LESDKDLPQGEQPVFIYHYLDGYEELERTRLWDGISSQEDEEVAIDTGYRAALIGMEGWENVKNRFGKAIVFEPVIESLKAIMGMAEAMELVVKVMNETRVQPGDKKKFGSQSDLGMGKSAEDVMEQPSAATSPTPSSPS
jgi:hypothetical protein